MPKDTGKKLADMLYGQNPEQAAFGVFPQMKGRRSKQDPEAAKNVPVDLMRGAVSGVLGAPGDLESLIRMLPGLDESRTILPTSEEIEGRLPFKSDTPVSRAATGLGQLGGGFYTGPGSPFKLAGALPSAVKKAGMDFAVAAGESGPKIFVGPKSKTWDKGRAAMAEAMEESGRSPKEIWLATGTIRGKDGILRQEISDKGTTFNMIDDLKLKAQEYKDMIEGKKALLTPDKSGQKDFWPKALTEAKKPVREEIAALKEDLRDISKNPRTQGVNARWTLEHPELYAAYPELAEIPVVQNYKTGPEKGALTTSNGRFYDMDIHDPINPRSVALHEMQHAVQNIEGMAPGANPLMAFTKPEWREMYEAYKKAELAGMPPGSVLSTKDEDRIAQKAANKWYERQHGEAEARATQARKDMSEAERAESFPYNSFDVNPDDLLTRPPIPYTGKADGGSVHISDNPDVMQLELAGGGLVKGLAKAISKAAESAGQKAPVLAEKELTTLQDTHTMLGDRVRARAMEAQKQMDEWNYKYSPGQHVFTEHGASKNLPPLRILERARSGNQVMRQDHPEFGPGMGKPIIDPATGKAMRTPYEPGYRVRRQNSPDPEDYAEFIIPEKAIIGDVEMAGGGLVKGLAKAAKAAKEAPSIIVPGTISKLQEEVAKKAGQYGAKRVQRAADEIPNLEKMYTEQALKEAFTGDNAKAVVTMNPADFEKYAQALEKRKEIGPKMAELAKQGQIDKYTVPTDEYIEHLMRLHGFDQVPYLNLFKDEAGLPTLPSVVGHEGRHRSRALSAQGQPSSLVQISPRGGLREDLPRRSQEEYIEALREELELSNKMVRPETRGSDDDLHLIRPAIELPDVYAEGGEVHMAGGGALSKLAKLARAPAKTKQEIEAIAERMAPQVTGEYVRKDAKSAKTVAGKTQKQFEREKNLPVDIRPIKEERIPEPVDIEKLKGEVMIGIPGDPTVAGKTLHSVGDVRLESPSPQHGGPLYGLYHDDNHFWASGEDAAKKVQNLARSASETYDAPVVGNYIMMGPDSFSYAQHFADANLQAIDLSKMSKKQIEEFNKLIREGYPYKKKGEHFQRVFPSFPGIEDKSSAYLHMAMDPDLRKHFNDIMQMPTVTERLNMPSGQDIRFAITEPPLRNLERGVTGYSLGRMRPDIPSEGLKLSEHPTYSHDIPGHFMGTSKYPMPYELTFPDTVKSIRENPKQAPYEFGTLQYGSTHQTIDQQLIDELKMYEERMKALTGKAAGGEVHGLSNEDMLYLQSQEDLAKMPPHAQREYITNMGGQELRQRMASKMAAGGEITADDLILEERKL